MRGKEQIDIRLLDIDCPELAQAFGRQAKKQTSDLCFGKTVTVKATGKDRYDRTLAHVILPNGKELNRELVRSGLAWWYRKYSDDESLGKLEADAKKSKRGLWAAQKPVAPWAWRAAKRAKSDVPISSIKVVPNGIRIIALLPNPNGTDAGHEQVTIANTRDDFDYPLSLKGWRLVDKAGNEFPLVGTLDPGKPLIVTMTESTMPLNNNGDEVLLIDAEGVGRSRVSYVESQVRSGVTLRLWVKPIEFFNLLAANDWGGVIKSKERIYVVERLEMKLYPSASPTGVNGKTGRSLGVRFHTKGRRPDFMENAHDFKVCEHFHPQQLFRRELSYVENCKLSQFQGWQEYRVEVSHTTNNNENSLDDPTRTDFSTQFTLVKDRLTGTVKSKGLPEISFDFKRMPKKKKAKDDK